MTRVAGVVLAAGAGTRMGLPKAEIVLEGSRLVDRAVAAMAACAEVVVVVRDGVTVRGARTVVNPEPDRGMRSSLRLALDAVSAADAVAVMLVDLPGVTAEAVTTVVRAWQPGRIAVGCFAGRRAHPTVMAPGDWREALERAGADEGARRFLVDNAERVDDVDVNGDPSDLDRPEDLTGWLRARIEREPGH